MIYARNTGIFIKGGTGTAVVSHDSPSRESWMKTQEVDIQARKLHLKLFLWFWTCSERSLRMETGVLHGISLHVS